MNSVLQMLFSLDEFQEVYCHQGKNHLENCDRYSADCFVCQFSKLGWGLLSGEYSIKKEEKILEEGKEKTEYYQDGIKIHNFKTLVGKDHPEFSSSRQQDALEYLQYLFGYIQKVEKQHNKPDITRIFKFTQATKLSCLSCGGIKIRENQTTELKINCPYIKQEKAEDEYPCDFNELCKSFLEGEAVEDVFCSKCNKKTVFIRRTFLKSFPKFLIVPVQRFVLDHLGPQKIQAYIHVELRKDKPLNFEPFKLPKNTEFVLPDEDVDEGPKVNEGALEALKQMGFGDNRATRALLANNNDPESAALWLFERMEDSSLDQPFAKKQKGKVNEINISPENIEAVVGMGFPESQARFALQKSDNNVERAIDYLFSHSAEEMIGEEEKEKEAAPKHEEAGESLENVRPKYVLQGAIVHLGKSVHCGHYVYYSRHENGWVLFNDRKVARTDEPLVGKAYILIYGVISLDRKEAIRNKMMILNKEYAKSRIEFEQSRLESKPDELSSQYFKMREEPQNLRLPSHKSSFGLKDNTKIDEETRNLNMSVLNKILKMPEEAFQVKPEFLELKNEIHENIKVLTDQAERIKNTQRDFSHFTRLFDSEENDSPPQLVGYDEVTEEKLRINFSGSPRSRDRKKGSGSTPVDQKEGTEGSKSPKLSSKYDFYALNKKRWGVNQNNIIELQKLPKEIDKISQMKSENDANILRSIPLNFSEKRKIQLMMDDMKAFISSDDEIHTNSCVGEPFEEELKEGNIDISIPFYLHLSSLSRELVSNRKTADDELKYDQKVLDFLNEKDYQINQERLALDDFYNILSGRISDKILARIFSGQEIHPLFEDFSDDTAINIRLPFEHGESVEKRMGSKPKSQKSSISQDLVKLFQKKYSTRIGSSLLQKTPTFTSRSLQEIYDEIGYPTDQLQHDIIEMNTIVQNNFVSWQDSDGLNGNRIGGLNKIEEEDESLKERKKRMILGDNKSQAVGIQVDVGNEEKSDSESDNDKNEEQGEEEEFQGFRNRNKGFKKSVNMLLKEISDLKDAKRQSLNMVNSQVMMKYIAEINMKIEQRLKTLLGLIMERDLEEERKEEVKVEESGNNAGPEALSALERVPAENGSPLLMINRASEASSQMNRGFTEKNNDESEIIEDETEVRRIKDREKMKDDLKKNLKIVVKDIDKLQGKFIDGHLKTKLLFQFLKEYRKLQEERQQEKMIELEESAILKEDVDNPFDNNINKAIEKENQQDNQKNRKVDSKYPTMKNLKVNNKGWDPHKNSKDNSHIKKDNSHIKKNPITFRKKASKGSTNKAGAGNWIGGGDFDEKEFTEGQNWKLVRK